MNKAILSVKHPMFSDRLKEFGYEIIPSETIPCRMEYERDHADLQCLILDDTAFVLYSCTRLKEILKENYRIISCGERFSGEYPNNVCLSAVKLGQNLICCVPSLDDKIKDYCNVHGYQLLHVNQGYTKCACAVVSDHAVITEDKGIYRALAETDFDVLLIKRGRVNLKGADCGFIGGASGYDKCTHTLYFCGSINNHPDGDRIKEFCNQHGTEIVNLSDDTLTDIGGILFC